MRLYRNGKIVLTFALLCGLGIAANPDTAAAQVRPQVTATQPAPNVEFRAMWVDAGSPGLHSPEEINQLLDFASANNFNALLVELHRKGNTFAAQSISPPGSSAKFDGLATLIPLAHARGIEVHAWINVLPVWYGADWPDNAHPVFNEHGFYTFEEGPAKTSNKKSEARQFCHGPQQLADHEQPWRIAFPGRHVSRPRASRRRPVCGDRVQRHCALLPGGWTSSGFHPLSRGGGRHRARIQRGLQPGKPVPILAGAPAAQPARCAG